jgi:hypothetical protein
VRVNAAERRRWEQLKADRHDIGRAAAWLRQRAWQEQYAGLHDKDRAFMLAGLLDTLALQLDRVDSAVRRDAVFACRWLLGERGT